jgi:transcriptional regulator with XRE-family HTH domain
MHKRCIVAAARAGGRPACDPGITSPFQERGCAPSTGRRVLLAQRRQAAGFTQEALAERLGVDRSTVVRWEAATSNPQPWLRSQLSDALGVTTDELCDLLDGVDVEQLARLDDGATSRQEEDWNAVDYWKAWLYWALRLPPLPRPPRLRPSAPACTTPS